jgi:hypothetical protein
MEHMGIWWELWMGTSAPRDHRRSPVSPMCHLHQLALARQVQCCLRLGTIRLAPEPMLGGKKQTVYMIPKIIYIIIYISNSDQQHVNSKLYSILKYIDVNCYKTKIIIWFCFNVQTNILACLTVLAFLGRTLCYHNPTMRVVCTGITEYCATRSWRTLSTSPVYSVHVQPRKDWFLRYSQFHCSSSYEPYTIHF